MIHSKIVFTVSCPLNRLWYAVRYVLVRKTDSPTQAQHFSPERTPLTPSPPFSDQGSLNGGNPQLHGRNAPQNGEFSKLKTNFTQNSKFSACSGHCKLYTHIISFVYELCLKKHCIYLKKHGIKCISKIYLKKQWIKWTFFLNIP